MYQALYRKYRPTNILDVVGQKVIVKTLSNEILNNKVNHAYLFAGPRGTGKTSVAKILAKTVNCLNLINVKPCEKCVSCTQINMGQTIDVIEIDAASNNGVDEIRELKSKVNLVPSTSKYKVYIIDEVHMLTTGAFNALLKTLEEPPAHVIFILATTDPQKIPTTIVSRCQRFDFKKISPVEIKESLLKIVNKENIVVNNDVLEEISRLSDGGLRDSINLLDQVIAYSNDDVTLNDVYDVSGTISFKEIQDLIINIFNKDIKTLFNKIDKYNNDGKNFNKLNEEIIYCLRNIILFKNAPDYFIESENESELYKSLSKKISLDEAIIMIQTLNENTILLKQNNNAKLMFELAVIKLINPNSKPNKEISDEIKKTNDMIRKVNVKDEIINNDSKEIKNNNNSNFETLKAIRINNALAGFKKENLKEIVSKTENLRSLLVIKKYSEIAKALLDCEIKVYGNNQLVYLCEDDVLCDIINENLLNAEQAFLKATGINVKIIIVKNDEWKKIKSEFNSKTKEYKYIEEMIDIQTLVKTKTTQNDEMTNMFGNVIEYK